MRFFRWLEERGQQKTEDELIEKFVKNGGGLSFKEFLQRETERLNRQTKTAIKISVIMIAATVVVQMLSLVFAIIGVCR